MQELMIRPTIYSFDDCRQFAEKFKLGEGDLLFTNKRLFKKFFEPLGLGCDVIFREDYGKGEPTDVMAEAIWKDVPKDAKRVVSVGGGSILDLSKLFALENISPVTDLYDGLLPIVKNKELVLVPTTCGTGSEVTNISILSLTTKGTKKGLAVEQLYGDSAVLIPELLEDLPFQFFATSSIDALVHSVESSLSPKGNETTRMFGYKAIEMILKGYMEIRDHGQEARIPLMKDFLMAANYAGIAFGNAGCAAVHALSYPLGAKYHVAHGESNYAMFTGVLNNYMEIKSDGEIARLNKFMAGILGCEVDVVYEELEKLLNVMIPKKALHEYGVSEEELEEFTDSVLENQGRLMANNFVELDRERVYKIYKECF